MYICTHIYICTYLYIVIYSLTLVQWQSFSPHTNRSLQWSPCELNSRRYGVISALSTMHMPPVWGHLHPPSSRPVLLEPINPQLSPTTAHTLSPLLHGTRQYNIHTRLRSCVLCIWSTWGFCSTAYWWPSIFLIEVSFLRLKDDLHMVWFIFTTKYCHLKPNDWPNISLIELSNRACDDQPELKFYDLRIITENLTAWLSTQDWMITENLNTKT